MQEPVKKVAKVNYGHCLLTVQEHIDKLLAHNDPDDYLIMDIWGVEDVEQAVSDYEDAGDEAGVLRPCDVEDLKQALGLMQETHDCNTGFTWEGAQTAYAQVMEEKREVLLRNLDIGDEVYWVDPDEGKCSGIGKVIGIGSPECGRTDTEVLDDLEVVWLQMEGGGESQVYVKEIM